MELQREWVHYEGSSGAVPAYLVRAKAADGPRPGVIVIQEVWGVDDHIADLCERLARAGYAALAPDLYAEGGERPQTVSAGRVERAKQFMDSLPSSWMTLDEQQRSDALSAASDGELVGETLGALFGGAQRDREAHLAALRPAVGFLRSHEACAGRSVASVGYCMGGGLSARLATESGLSGAVIYYGGSPEPEQVARISCPIRGFYGREDTRIVAGLPEFAAALTAAGIDHKLRVYPDAGHAFFNDMRPSYRPEPARDAWARTLGFLAATLEPAPNELVEDA